MPSEDKDAKQESLRAATEAAATADADLRTLLTFATTLLAQNDLDDLLWSMAENIGSALRFEDCVIYLRETDELVQMAAHGIKNPEGRRIRNAIRISLGQGIVGTVAKTGRAERVRDTASDARYILDEFAGRSELAVPLVYEGKVLGVLDSEGPTLDWFTEADQEMFERVAVLAAPRIASALAQREWRKVEEALRESEHKYKSLINHSPDPIFVSRIDDFVLTEVNQRACIDYGYTQEEFLTMNIFDLEVQAPLREYVRHAYDEMEVGQVVEVDGVNRRKDGSAFPVHVRFTKLDDEFALAVVRDITERRRMEEALLRKERLAAIGQLTATVSHELRNPLGTIKTSMFSIRERTKEKGFEFERVLDRVERSLVRCDSIIDDLHEFARGLELDRQRTNLDSWMAGVLADQRVPTGIDVIKNLGAGAEIPLDRVKMIGVINNLIENAVQAIQSGQESDDDTAATGRIEVSSRVDDSRVVISVADSGPGFPREDLAKVFEPLFTTKARGVGLGLSIVQKVVVLHGGAVSAENGRDGGAVVTLELPLELSTS